MDPRSKQGLNGAGADEPAVASGAAGGNPTDLAAAIESAAKAEGDLADATQKRQRLNQNDPAVVAAKAAEAAARDLITAEEQLTRTVEARQRAQAGLSSGPGVDRRNDLLDEAFGEQPGDRRTQEAIRAERELADLMRERLELARTLAGQPSVPSAVAGEKKGYTGPATVGGERVGGHTQLRETELDRLAAKLEPARNRKREMDISDTRASDGGGLIIHDERRAVVDRRRAERERDEFREQLEEKRKREAEQPGIGAMTKSGLGTAISVVDRVAAAAGRMSDAANTPFMSSRDRGIQMIESVPVIGDAISGLGKLRQDLQEFGGRGKGQEAAVITGVRGDLEVAANAEWARHMQMRGESLYTQQALDARAGTIRQQIGDPSRSTLGERQRYDLEVRQMPVKDRLADAQTALDRATAKGRSMGETVDVLTQKMRALIPDQEAAVANEEAAKKSGNIKDLLKARARLVQIEKWNEGFAQERQKMYRSQQENELEVIARRRSVSEARIGVQEVGLDDARQREGVARSQAQRLGMLGIDGRMQAILNKQIIDQIGAENAPGALLQNAAVAFPETIAKDAERAGQRVQPQFQALGKDEYRDTVSEAEKRTNEALDKLRAAQEEAIRSEADLITKAFSKLGEVIYEKRLGALEAIVGRLIREAELKNTK